LICIPYPIFVGSKIEKNEMDGARPTHRWEDNINIGSSGIRRGLWGLDGVGSE
jgi:hypothetical protein